MKKGLKKVIAVALAAVIVLGSVFVATPEVEAASAAKSITTSQVNERIKTLSKKLNGKYFTTDGKAAKNSSDNRTYLPKVIKSKNFKKLFGFTVSNINLFPKHAGNRSDTNMLNPKAYSCAGFAAFAEWYIFNGGNNSAKVSTKVVKRYVPYNYASLSKWAKPGDMLRFDKKETGKKEIKKSTHSAIVVSVNKKGVRVIDSNSKSGPNNVAIRTIKYGGRYVSVAISRAKNHNVTSSTPTPAPAKAPAPTPAPAPKPAPATASTLKAAISNPPSSVKIGSTYNLKGSITSNYKITNASSWITNSKGATVGSRVNVTPNTTSVNIQPNALNQNLKFKSITAAGTYYLHLYAKDASGKKQEQVYKFSAYKPAAASTLKVSVSNPPSTFKVPGTYNLKGSITSNYKIINASSWITNNRGATVGSRVNVTPNSTSVNIQSNALNKKLKFGSIKSAGTYYLHVYAKDASGKTQEQVYKFTAKKI